MRMKSTLDVIRRGIHVAINSVMEITMVGFHTFATKSTSSDRIKICYEAVSWLGTPYQHQAMVKGESGGVDCAMFIAGTALGAGLIGREDIEKIPPYPAEWHYHSDFPMLTEVMKSFGCEMKNGFETECGDILAFQIGKTVSHLGIYLGDQYFIHAEGRGPMKVTTTTLNGPWEDRLVEIYTFPGIE